MKNRQGRARKKPQRDPVRAAPRVPPPPRQRPQLYRLTVRGRTRAPDAGVGMDEPGIVLVEGGPLGLCENRGFQVALYGLFFLRDDGRRVWGKPLSIEIEPVKPEAEEA